MNKILWEEFLVPLVREPEHDSYRVHTISPPPISRIFPWKHTILHEFLFENTIIFQDFL